MGLIKAALGAAGVVMADQWKEYIYCESMPADVLVTKGQKRTGKRSSNTSGEDNVITNGSLIAVNEGQCMLIVENGKVAKVNFSRELQKNFVGGSTGEEMLVGSVVNTLTEFPEIQKVQILVDGQEVETLSGHMDLSQPLPRMTELLK